METGRERKKAGHTKKKILMVSHFMELGGAERALLGLLNEFDYNKYEVSLFLFRQEGELLSKIPKEVRLLPEIPQYAMLACPVSRVLHDGHLWIAAARVAGKYSARLYNVMHHYGRNSQVEIEYSHKFTRRFLPQITPEITYDLAVSFLTPHYFVAEKVKARKKVAWIHTDYSKIPIDVKSEQKMWQPYDAIAAVSDACQEAFVQRFPSMKKKVVKIENLLAVDFLREQAKMQIPEGMKRDGEIVLLSVGRFCYAKNFDNVPDICRRIREKGVSICWYLIGFGTDEEKIRREIAANDMQEYVILLGKKENPYPYMAQCDWYVQPSRFEGKAVTVREAQALHKPVMITAYPTAESQLADGYDGVIVPLDNEACAEKIADLLTREELQKALIRNTYRKDYANREEIQKLYAFTGEEK